MAQNKAGGVWANMQGGTVQIAVIYMASGFGKRFGRNKLLAPVNGKALYLHGLEKFILLKENHKKRNTASEQKNFHIRIVLVSQWDEILQFGHRQGLICVKNDQAEEGISASIRLGLEAAGEADYYLFSVADQPWLKQETLEAFICKFLEVKEHYSIGCLCEEHGGRKNPVVFHQRYRKELFMLRGDKGGSQVAERCPGEIFRFFTEEKELKDIDRICDISS